jgi:hypothetical protein
LRTEDTFGLPKKNISSNIIRRIGLLTLNFSTFFL